MGGPVAGVGDDEGEGGAVGGGDRGEGVPFFERGGGDADAGDGADFLDVAEVQADGVFGEVFDADGNVAEAEPGVDDGEGDGQEEPECWGAEDEDAEGLGVGGLGCRVVEEEEENPEEGDGCPASEAVDQFEGVVGDDSEAGDCEEGDCHEEDEEAESDGQNCAFERGCSKVAD